MSEIFKFIKIRKIKLSDVSKNWVNWLNDREVNRFSQQKNKKHSLKSQKEFIKRKLKDGSSVIYGVFYNKAHIGNIELGMIDFINKNCEVSYVIGEKAYWGKNIATISINLVLDKAFKEYKLKKIYAGTYSNNISSQRVLLKNNFIKEGELSNFYQYNSFRVSKIIFGLEKKKYKKYLV